MKDCIHRKNKLNSFNSLAFMVGVQCAESDLGLEQEQDSRFPNFPANITVTIFRVN